MTMRRRDAIKAIGALTGAATASKLLSACGDNGGPTGITTLVYLMMENRSYDHYLGSRAFEGKPGDGLDAAMSNPDRMGNSIPIWPATPEAQCVLDPPHGWDASRVQRAEGANTGFVIAHQDNHASDTAIEPMQYMLREHVPVTHALADAYTTCDRWHCSLLGPTLPNRMYWHAGTANGAQSNDEVIDGAFRGVPTIYHRLASAGVDWAYYYGDVPVVSFVEDLDLDGRIRRFLYDFLDDADAGRLPPVCYIDPGFSYNDDHPPHHPLLGQQLIATVYQTLATSPQWENCLLVVTYDENGGFFDHVPPPTAPDDRADQGFDQLGFRVPSLVVGPYAKSGFVSSVAYDHTSALKHIENMFALEPLTTRSSAANDLSDCIDLARLEANDPAPPIELPAVEIDESSLPESCRGESLRAVDHDILRWADRRPDLVARWDRRRHARDSVYAIGDYLERHGLGRIRRGR
jgi:phospholipase C